MKMNGGDACCGFMIFLIAGLIFGLGISVVIIYTERNDYAGKGETCPTVSLLDRVVAEKKLLKQWHWTYKVQEYNAQFEQYCPTTQHDVNVFVDGKFAMRSDGKIVTTLSTTHILDCHGDVVYTTRTANIFDTIINGNKIFVSFELRSGNEHGDIIAYADQTNFFSNEVKIRDIHGNLIVEMNRNLLTFSPYTWEYKFHNQTHPAANILMLMTITGKVSFSDSDDSTDVCNSYFWGVSWFTVAILSAVALVIVVTVGYICICAGECMGEYFKNGCCNWRKSRKNVNPNEINYFTSDYL